MGLAPISQPPGKDSLHCPALPKSAPINIIEERISRISPAETEVQAGAEAFTLTEPPSRRQLHPSAASIRQAASQSVNFGQLYSVVCPEQSTEAAKSGKALFFAPCIGISPSIRLPPRITSF